MEGFALYIHIPFCMQKCHYCDFNSFAVTEATKKRFMDCILLEIDLLAKKYKAPLKTIFFGGGTPTILSGEELLLILDRVREKFTLLEGIEISSEANPETVNKEQLTLLKQGGFNRLSFGVQSFSNHYLKKLGRVHTANKAIESYYLAREIGFDNLNLDLIFALPGQSMEEWQDTLEQAVRLNPEHLSTYNLKIEEGTRFYQLLTENKISPVSEDLDLAMYNYTKEFLEAKGYQQYEISNFAKEGLRSKHNQIYWLNQPYLSLGPGAHFYDGRGRGYNFSRLEDYFQAIRAGKLPVAEYHQLSREEEIEETLMLGLRLIDGISLEGFSERYGIELEEVYQRELKQLLKNRLIKVEAGRLSLTEQGILLANQVLAEFILT